MARLSPEAFWEFAGEIAGTIKLGKTSALGTVTRIDSDGTTWVSVGGSAEAPAASAIASVAVGDTVSVNWSGTQMTITGNSTDPPSSSTTVEELAKAVKSLQGGFEKARSKLVELAGYVWHDSNGVHLGRSDKTPDDVEMVGRNDYDDGYAYVRVKNGDSIELAVVDTYGGVTNYIGAIWLHWVTSQGGMVLELVFDKLRFANTYIARADLLKAITRDSATVELHNNASGADTHIAYRSGNVVTVSIVNLNLAAALADGSNVWVATVPDGYRPQSVAYAVLGGYRNNGSYVTVDTSGYVYVRNYSGSSIPTTRDLGATVTYCI